MGPATTFLADRQGSTIALVSATGCVANRYSYDPYGAQRTITGIVPNPWQYNGGYRDTTTGLYHLQARYYDPTLGRFTQPDPSGREANTYA
jgi:RHS repeat-associated protein